MGTYSTLTEPSRNEAIAVGTTAVSIAVNSTTDTPRKNFILRNISPNAADIITVWLSNEAAKVNTGIVLRQFESITDATDSGYQCWQGQISAICATATGVLAVFER
jgi:sugar (pentulose or hexulose) kinase